MKAKYIHTNLITHNWRALAAFYQNLFGCTPVPPERDLSGAHIDLGTGIQDAHITGVHLRLPGYGEDGPTLEVFSYDELALSLKPVVNQPGFGHIAFLVEDVAAAQQQVLDAGGAKVGGITQVLLATGVQLTWCYVTDPDGNIIELQSSQPA